MLVNAILLIDDDEDDREFFIEAIEELGPDVTCVQASNGQEGLDILVKREFTPDVIFLDLNMPLMNGQKFLKEIKKYDKVRHIPIVILTTSSDSRTIAESLASGASHFITKPDQFSQWESTLSDYFNSASTP